MSELTKIILGLSLALLLIYGLIIRFSVTEGKSLGIYIACICANVFVGLWFWYIASRPTDDPQAGMGLGPIMIACGFITVAIPLIAIIIYLVRRFIN